METNTTTHGDKMNTTDITNMTDADLDALLGVPAYETVEELVSYVAAVATGEDNARELLEKGLSEIRGRVSGGLGFRR